ncbi:MAG: uroporphyrinogen-III C-methyltransferase [Alphaproteobacteria bacterium]|nr:MAG: uroporphyrinogen-III C-methyltransferase [Alphaproteobacteria bacterium]
MSHLPPNPSQPEPGLSHFPIFLELARRAVGVIGDGAAADTKAALLARAGAEVRRWSTPPDAAAFAGLVLVIAALDDAEAVRACQSAARAAGALFNAVDQPAVCDFQVPSMIERGPMTIAIGTGGAAPTLARTVRSRIEAAVPPAYGALARMSQRLRPTVRRLLPRDGDRRRFWQAMATGRPADLMLAGQPIAAEREAERLLADSTPPPPLVHLVGAGPGDPELLTRRAARLIAEADVILHDALIGPEILTLARRDARLIDVGKRCGRHRHSQADINALLVAEAQPGRVVVRLKGGDPFVFGRGGEEAEHLATHGIDVAIVPGITAALGAAASLKRALTRRGVAGTLTVATGHPQSDGAEPDWEALGRVGGSLAIYMGSRSAHRLAAELIAGGRPPETPAWVVEHATLPTERTCHTTLRLLGNAVASNRFTGPTMVLIGEALAEPVPPPCAATVATATERSTSPACRSGAPVSA